MHLALMVLMVIASGGARAALAAGAASRTAFVASGASIFGVQGPALIRQRSQRGPERIGLVGRPLNAGRAGVPSRAMHSSRTLKAQSGMSSANKFELEGKLKVKFDIQTFSSGFFKREFILSTEEMYPQDVKFELIKDKCNLLDNVPVGTSMKVKFNIRGSMWQDKYFVNLVAWYIEAGDAADDFEGMDGIPGFVTNGDRRIAGGGAGGMGASMNDLGGVWDEPAAMNPQPATPAPFSTGGFADTTPQKMNTWDSKDEEVKF